MKYSLRHLLDLLHSPNKTNYARNLLTIFALTTSSLQALTIDDDWGSEKITRDTSTLDKGGGAISINMYADYIGESDFDKRGYRHEHIQFSEAEINLSTLVYFDRCYVEGVSLGIDYNTTFIKWKENYFFSRQHFDTIGFSVAGFSQRLSDWLWKGAIQMNIDADYLDFSDYTTWDLLLWGRYTYSKTIGLHAGFLAWTGMKVDRVWPIVGVDWTISEKWKLNAIFPLNVSIVYSLNDIWSFSLAGRAFQNRHRAGKHSAEKKAIVEYQNTGVELGVNYDRGNWINANFHVGSTFGGRLKIANRNNNHPHHFDFKAAPYVGGEVELSF